MGGKAFGKAFKEGQPILNTPRMSKEFYFRLREHLKPRLDQFFKPDQVAALLEAPEKDSFGDLDFVVARSGPTDFLALAAHLGATAIVYASGRKPLCHMAVRINPDSDAPSPVVASSHPPIVYQLVEGTGQGAILEATGNVTAEPYAQIDVEIIAPEEFEWFNFISSYSHLGGILGQVVHAFGLSVTQRGLVLKLPEYDDNKEKAHTTLPAEDWHITLSNDAASVVKFLGMDYARYQQGFVTLEALYEWLSSCRLLCHSIMAHKAAKTAHKRKAQRPIFINFFENFLPARFPGLYHVQSHELQPAGVNKIMEKRKEILKEAIDFFQQRAEYETKRAALIQSLKQGTAAYWLSKLAAQHSYRSGQHLTEVVRSLRRFITIDATTGRISIRQMPCSDEQSETHKLIDDELELKDPLGVDAFVRDHWDETRDLLRARAKANKQGKEPAERLEATPRQQEQEGD